jgi:hypothetical protein
MMIAGKVCIGTTIPDSNSLLTADGNIKANNVDTCSTQIPNKQHIIAHRLVNEMTLYNPSTSTIKQLKVHGHDTTSAIHDFITITFNSSTITNSWVNEMTLNNPSASTIKQLKGHGIASASAIDDLITLIVNTSTITNAN